MKVSGNICNTAVIKFVYFIRIALEAQAGLFTAVCSILATCQEISEHQLLVELGSFSFMAILIKFWF